MFIAMNVHSTKEITEYGTSDAKLYATITDIQKSGNSMFKRKEQTMNSIAIAVGVMCSLSYLIGLWVGKNKLK